MLEILEQEGPLHEDDLETRTLATFGHTRAGKNIRRHVDEAFRALADQREVEQSGGSWRLAAAAVKPRTRATVAVPAERIPVQGTPVQGTAAQDYNLLRLNQYRASIGRSPLIMDAQLNAFAVQGSQELMQNHVPHGHFANAGNAGTLFTTDGFQGYAVWPYNAAPPPFKGRRLGWSSFVKEKALMSEIIAAWLP
jgi:uncharacterized protein YkwD